MPDGSLSFVECAGHRVACLSHLHPNPEGLPVFWIHGLTMSVRFWEEAMYERVREERSWFSISLPLHAPSTFDGRLTPETLCEDLFADLLAEAIDRLVPEGQFHIVGHSLGAFAALNYAAKHPARVASIVSIGGFMTGRAEGVEGALQFLSKGNFARKLLFHFTFRVLQSHVFFLKFATLTYSRAWWKLLRFPALDPTLRAVFPDVKNHSIAAQQAFCRYLLDMNLLDELDNIQAPVLVMAGEKDPIIPVEHQIEYATRLPRGHLVLFSGTGQVCFGESPELFEKTLLEWLEKEGS